jgi:hypothetical protein
MRQGREHAERAQSSRAHVLPAAETALLWTAATREAASLSLLDRATRTWRGGKGFGSFDAIRGWFAYVALAFFEALRRVRRGRGTREMDDDTRGSAVTLTMERAAALTAARAEQWH